jgi:uncharacterized membrane protein
MSNYVALVFKTDSRAHDTLRMLWNMDEAGDLTVHGAAVVRRDENGYIDVASKHTDAGMRTAVGIGVGMLLGVLAGPVGVAAGIASAAAATAGTAIGLGAVAGGVVGLAADAVKSDYRSAADIATYYHMRDGESAVVADVSEDWPNRLDAAVKAMGCVVYRKSDASNYFADYERPYYYNSYLYPYYYDTRFS